MLEPSEMIVIDYPDVHRVPTTTSNLENGTVQPANGTLKASSNRRGVHSMNLEHMALLPPSSSRPLPKQPLYPPSNRHQQMSLEAEDCCTLAQQAMLAADGSSAVVAQRSPSARRLRRGHSAVSTSSCSTSDRLSATLSTSDPADEQLAGLPEANVDSDEDDESCPSAECCLGDFRDEVRDCLEKVPAERGDDDLHVLLSFVQRMRAFACLPLAVQRQLCRCMVFAEVLKAGEVVMKDGEQLDSWSVVVNGEVELELPNGQRRLYQLGDSFGVDLSAKAQYLRGVMRTTQDDCQFVLVAQRDYLDIMSKVRDHYERHKDAAGEIVSETERRTLANREGYVLIKGKAEKLISHLVDERDTSVDPNYVEDFLLTYRAFIDDPSSVFERLNHWFSDDTLRDKVNRIVLLWVNNHFNDFESNPELMTMLERYEAALEREGSHSVQAMLNIACSVKSRSRTVTYTRSSRDEVLAFSVLGGHDKGQGLFVSHVERNSQAEKVGLKRADQILEVNGQSCEQMSHKKLLELLRSSSHVSMVVKSNLLSFKEMLCQPAQQHVPDGRQGAPSRMLPYHGRAPSQEAPRCGLPRKTPSQPTLPLCQLRRAACDPAPADLQKSSASKLLGKLIKGFSNAGSTSDYDFAADAGSKTLTRSSGQRARLKPSRSNPDLTSTLQQQQHYLGQTPLSSYYAPVKSACPEHVLKIYRADQAFKYLTVYKETTCQNVVQLAIQSSQFRLQEFGMQNSSGSGSADGVGALSQSSASAGVGGGGVSRDWSLSEVSMTTDGGVIKQRRLPDQMQNLAERITLNARYYLKNNHRQEKLVPDELAPELVKEAQVQLMQLNAQILAAQLTLQDFAALYSIQPSEMVDNLLKIETSRYGWPKLLEFEGLVNKEMWWVVTEVVNEKSAIRRAKLIRKFIKIARHAKDFNNFNTMFALMSGLEKPAVRRLQQTWDKIPNKYNSMFHELQKLLDPSRNMSKYRQHVAGLVGSGELSVPVIPLYPVVKKDLTFINEGNPTYCDGLINFEKLRMIGREVRTFNRFASLPYDLKTMSMQCGSQLQEALLHMNNFGSNVVTCRHVHHSRPPQPRKKLYEQALMVRKVKAYLENLNVISDESQLDRMSAELEPPSNSGSVGNIGGRPSSKHQQRQPSPSPSSNSSVSNHSTEQRRLLQQQQSQPKFGADSPQAMRKMCALVDHSRQVQVQQQLQGHFPSSCPNVLEAPTRRNGFYYARVPPQAAAEPQLRRPSQPTGPFVYYPSPPPPPVALTEESSSVTPAAAPFYYNYSRGSTGSSADSGAHSQSSLSSPRWPDRPPSNCDSTDGGGGRDQQQQRRDQQQQQQPPAHLMISHRAPQLIGDSSHLPANERRPKKGCPPPPPLSTKPKNYINVQVAAAAARRDVSADQISRV